MNSYEILGIGAPVIDYILHVDSSFIDQLAGEKEGMVAIDESTLTRILSQFHLPNYTIGGSACNTIKGLAKFNHSCAFWGKIGNDNAGEIFKKRIEELGIKAILNRSLKSKTASALCFVTKDGNRTMRTHLGASLEMRGDELNREIFKGIKLLHMEGYSLLKEELVLTAFKMAKEEGALISIDLSSFEIIEQFRSTILELMEFVDIVFANEKESHALIGQNSYQNCLAMNQLAKIAIVLCGKKGCLIGNNNRIQEVPTREIPPKDSTGAGDFFASGFLHGFLKGKGLIECAQLGNRAASAVIQIDGTDISDSLWNKIID